MSPLRISVSLVDDPVGFVQTYRVGVVDVSVSDGALVIGAGRYVDSDVFARHVFAAGTWQRCDVETIPQQEDDDNDKS